MGDIATAPPAGNEMAFDPEMDMSDQRRPSTSSYGSSSNGMQNTPSAAYKLGRGSVSSTEGYSDAILQQPYQYHSAHAPSSSYRQRPGSARPRTAGSEASSARSSKSMTNGAGAAHAPGERSSPVANHASRLPKIVPMASRPGSAEDLSSFEYELVVRQQPKQARLCSGNDKLPKGPVDPPPVVRLQISRSVMRPSSQPQSHLKPPATANSDDSNLSSESGLAQSKANQASKLTSASLIQSPYLFCFAALCKADEDEELYLLADGKTRYVTGNVVSSLYHLKDPRDGSAEGFFVFPDIGVRVEGTFRLKLSLYEMVDATVHHCKTVYTDPFQVYSPKRFPGIQDSTELSKSFATQGLKMRIKGGPARTGGKPVDGPPRTGTSEYSRPGSSGSSSLAKRPRTASESMYNYLEEGNKRRAIDTSLPAAYQRDVYGSFRYQPQPGINDREMHSVPEAGVYQPRPVSSSYTAMRTEPDPQSYPSSIDARARFREQQYYPPRTAAAAPDRTGRPTGLSAYPPPGLYVSSQRPTTAPAIPSPHALADPYSHSPSRQHYPYPHQNHLALQGARPSSSGEHMPPPRNFGPPAAPRYPPSDIHDSYQPYPQNSTHTHYTHAPPEPHLPRIQPLEEMRSRPSSSSGAQRITLPSLSEMIRRPDLDLLPTIPTIPASTSSLRTLLNPEAKLLSVDHSPSAQRDIRASAALQSRGPSPARSEEPDHPSEEDRRYYEIRARQMLHRRPSANDDL